eukprot:12926881-Prorocentrum_lima.AAC.1
MFTVLAAARPCATGGVGHKLSQTGNSCISMVEVRVPAYLDALERHKRPTPCSNRSSQGVY